MRKTGLVSNRSEALTFISANLKQLHVMAVAHRLHLIDYLLGMAYTESYDTLRRERARAESHVAKNGKARGVD